MQLATITSSSHTIQINEVNEGKQIQLTEGDTFLDRNLVLNFTLAIDKASALSNIDYEGYVALASFFPVLPKGQAMFSQKSRTIKLLVDCSQSMVGEPIAQVKVALLNILDLLNEQDYFVLVRFGTTVAIDIPSPIKATKENIMQARDRVIKMEADLGDTEIFTALYRTLKLSSGNEENILLITDGNTWDGAVCWVDLSEYAEEGILTHGSEVCAEERREQGILSDTIISIANKTQQRIFTVGVGNAVSELLMRKLADGTNASCELVNPRERMAEKIEQQFKRIYVGQAQSVEIEWPIQPFWQSKAKPLFIGDTLHVFARFKKEPVGKVKLRADFGNKIKVEQLADIKFIDSGKKRNELSRITANEYFKGVIGEEKDLDAIKYQVMTADAAYVIVDMEPEWGGVGVVRSQSEVLFLTLDGGFPPKKREFKKIKGEVALRTEAMPIWFADRCHSFFSSDHPTKLVIECLSQLLDAGLDKEVFYQLEFIAVLTHEKDAEYQVVVCFLYYLLENCNYLAPVTVTSFSDRKYFNKNGNYSPLFTTVHFLKQVLRRVEKMVMWTIYIENTLHCQILTRFIAPFIAAFKNSGILIPANVKITA